MNLQDKLIASYEDQDRKNRLKIDNLQKEIDTLSKNRFEDMVLIAKLTEENKAGLDLIKCLEEMIGRMQADVMIKSIINS